MLLQSINQLNPPPTEWLWPGYLAAGSLAILDGDPGQGKSMLTLDLAARLTTARPWPDGAPCPEPAAVVLLSAEDSDAVIRDRLTALNADLGRTFVWPREGEVPHFPAGHDSLDQALAEIARGGALPRLVVIDPIVAFLERSIHTNSDAAVRRALAPLARLAEKHRCAILLVRHLTKKASPAAVYRGAGSIGFMAACRLAWLVGPDPKTDDRFILAQSKNNYAARCPSLAYTLSKTTPPIAWHGPSSLTADELAEQRLRPGRRRIREYLRRLLVSGPRPAKEIWAAARAQGYSRTTLLRAKADLSIRTERTYSPSGRCDYWLLPGQKAPSAPSATSELDRWLERWNETYRPRPPALDEDAA